MVEAHAGIQSVARTFAVLEAIADGGGEVGVSDIASALTLPVPTIHRILRTLVELGYVRQLPSRKYALGPTLIRLGDRASSMLPVWATPVLEALESTLHETANLAVLDGTMVAYAAQVPSRHHMRMFTEVGRRVYPHAAGVGKAILASLDDDAALSILRKNGLPGYTPSTIVDEAAMMVELSRIRSLGYAVDDGEQERGVRCLAVAVAGAPSPMAVSVSGPSARMSVTDDESVVKALQIAAKDLRSALAST